MDSGHSAGLEPANTGNEGDARKRTAAYHIERLAEAQKIAEDIGEWRLAREIEDTVARFRGQKPEEVQHRRVDGENPQDARQEKREVTACTLHRMVVTLGGGPNGDRLSCGCPQDGYLFRGPEPSWLLRGGYWQQGAYRAG